MLDREVIDKVIDFCNRDLVPTGHLDTSSRYQKKWFIGYFSFLRNESLAKHLGDAFYQARFIYKLMNALELAPSQHRGIVKFQIVQYASICEAILDEIIEKYYGVDAATRFSTTEYVRIDGALSVNTKITFNGINVEICKKKTKKNSLKRTRIDAKTQYAVEKTIISADIKRSIDELYDLRNNVHILKAAKGNYVPKVAEAKEAFRVMKMFVKEVKNFYRCNFN